MVILKLLPVFNLKPDDYILSKNLNQSEVQTFFKLKTRMVNLADNFRNGSDSLWCKICMLFRETQSHLLSCPILREKLKDIVDFNKVKYEHIIGDLAEQEELAKTYTLIMKTREDLIDG